MGLSARVRLIGARGTATGLKHKEPCPWLERTCIFKGIHCDSTDEFARMYASLPILQVRQRGQQHAATWALPLVFWLVATQLRLNGRKATLSWG
jgi:hypothetical protein